MMSRNHGTIRQSVWEAALNQAGVIDLFERYSGAVHRRCLRLLGDREMARDATQDVFTKLLANRRLERLDRPLNFLYRSATNTCIDLMRRQKTRGGTVPLLETDLMAPSESGRILARSLLEKCMRRLPRRAIEVAFAVHMDGMTQDEAAEELGVSRKTVQRDLAQVTAILQETTGERGST